MSEQSEENLVKKTCKELGMTQKELAEKIGVSRQTVSDWANNKTPIPKWGFTIFELLEMKQNYINLSNAIKNNIDDKLILI